MSTTLSPFFNSSNVRAPSEENRSASTSRAYRDLNLPRLAYGGISEESVKESLPKLVEQCFLPAESAGDANLRCTVVQGSTRVIGELWDNIEMAEMILLLGHSFTGSAEEVMNAAWKLLLTNNINDIDMQTQKTFNTLTQSKFSPPAILGTTTDPYDERSAIRFFLNNVIKPAVQMRLRRLIEKMRECCHTVVNTHPDFADLHNSVDLPHSRDAIAQKYLSEGTGLHKPGFDVLTNQRISYFAAAPLKMIVAHMLSLYPTPVLLKAFKSFEINHFPIEIMGFPSIMLESEITFQRARGSSYAFPSDALQSIMSQERKSIADRHEILKTFKQQANESPHFFAIQIQVLFPLRLEILGPPLNVVPQLSFLPLAVVTSPHGAPTAPAQGDPTAPPSQGAPTAPPTQGAPAAPPSQGAPAAPPAQGTPTAPPAQAAPPAHRAPAAPPAHRAPAPPAHRVPTAPIVIPGEAVTAPVLSYMESPDEPAVIHDSSDEVFDEDYDEDYDSQRSVSSTAVS